MGNQLIVVLNSFESIKDAYVKNGDAVSGRVKATLQPKEFANAGKPHRMYYYFLKRDSDPPNHSRFKMKPHLL